MAVRSWEVLNQAKQIVPEDRDFRVSLKEGRGEVGVRLKRFHGGLSDGVLGLELDNGAWRVMVLPTRGMSIWKAWVGETELGWRSPVRGPVHPHFVPVMEPSGLGWLDGFDELLVRCGLESNGAPDFDEKGRLRYPLHGRVGNWPAEQVVVQVDEETGVIEVTGTVTESRFHFFKAKLETKIRLTPGETRLELVDRVTNLSASPAAIQMLYHVNFGLPLLDAGARVVVPAKNVVPRNPHAAQHLSTWDHFAAEQAGFEEQVYFMDMWADKEGRTETLLKNAHGTQGVTLRYPVAQLPCFTLWKNTTAGEDGYVTGLEPGTNYPNPRSFEKQEQREKTLAGGSSCEFQLEWTYLGAAAAVEAAEKRIAQLAQAPPVTHSAPLPRWCAS